jgi:hypothetical protein
MGHRASGSVAADQGMDTRAATGVRAVLRWEINVSADVWYWLAVASLIVIGFVCLLEELRS